MPASIRPGTPSVRRCSEYPGIPIPFRSNGTGGFAEGKNYYSTQMWAVQLNRSNRWKRPRGEDGTFNGCPAPSELLGPRHR